MGCATIRFNILRLLFDERVIGMEARFGGDAPSGLFLCCSSVEIITLNETIVKPFFRLMKLFRDKTRASSRFSFRYMVDFLFVIC